MHWENVAAIVAVLAGFIAAARWWTRAIIREENERQLRQINGTYVRAAGAAVTGAEVARRLEHIETKLDVIGDKVSNLHAHVVLPPRMLNED